MRHDLSRGFRRAVRIVAAKLVGFAIRPDPFAVAVDLVARDDDGGFYIGLATNAVEQIGRAHDITRKRVERVLIRGQDDWLCGEVKDDSRLVL